MLLALVLVWEQSFVVIQLVLRMMMKVHWMLLEVRSMELDHRISVVMVQHLAEMVRLLLKGHWLELDPEPLLVVVAQSQFVHVVPRSSKHSLELRPLDLLVRLVCHRCCPKHVVDQSVTCLEPDFEFFERLLDPPRQQRWSECNQPCWPRSEEGLCRIVAQTKAVPHFSC